MGGPAHQAALLSGRRFCPERYETLLVHGRVAADEESMADLVEREGARSLYLPSLVQPLRPAKDAETLARLISIARRFRPHIVHTHTAKAGFLGRAAALGLRPRPVIFHTYHGHVLEGYFGPARSALYRGLERALGRVSDRLIGVSQATVDDLIRLGVAPRERFRVVPLGLDLDRFEDPPAGSRSEIRDRMDVAEDEVLLVYVGRVVPIKRLDVLLRAVALATRADAPLKLAIVGDGSERPGLEELARSLGIVSRVSFLGYRRDLERIYAGGDVGVLSSDNEGTPVSLIEAGAAGLPAVATRVGGVPDVVSPEAGLCVAPDSPAQLADALLELAAEPTRRQEMGVSARSRMAARYSIARLIRDLDALYAEALGDARRSCR